MIRTPYRRPNTPLSSLKYPPSRSRAARLIMLSADTSRQTRRLLTTRELKLGKRVTAVSALSLFEYSEINSTFYYSPKWLNSIFLFIFSIKVFYSYSFYFSGRALSLSLKAFVKYLKPANLTFGELRMFTHTAPSTQSRP